jgi:hypothetical protein
MYIVLSISSTQYSFQKKDEAGVNIGTSQDYLQTDYKLDRTLPFHIAIQEAAAPLGAFPPVIAYPIDRVVIIKT